MQNLHIDSRIDLAEDASDAELVAGAVAGSVRAFERIMRRHNRLLFRTARSILRSDEDAEDVLQEAYLHAWRALAGFRAEARLSTWLVRIVVNEALGRLRLRQRGAQVIPLDNAIDWMETQMEAPSCEQPEPAAMRAQMRRLIEAHIDLLPDTFRTVFMLRAVEEMSVQEVASALGIPEATVRTRFLRARSQLREGLAGDVDQAIDEAFAFDGQRCDRIVARVLAVL